MPTASEGAVAPARKGPNLDTYEGRCAERLKELREKAGITVPELAEQCGVAVRTIYSWESGERDIQVAALPMLAEIFGLKTPRSVLAGK